MKNLVVIAGPTAVGKTGLAIELAAYFKTQILSADSRQCYRELGIAVAKPSPTQLAAVQHYFIDSHSVQENVDARVFEQYATNSLAEIFDQNDFAVVVGGTGLYIRALLQGMDEIPAVDPGLRHSLNEYYKEKGLQWLKDELKRLDPLFYANGEIQNPQRSLRALEVVVASGRSILSFHSKSGFKKDYNIIPFHLSMEREVLYSRINNRVEEMVNSGLVEEAAQLYPLRHLNALQTVGYRELFDYFENKTSLENAINLVKQNTRHYAKRQQTWFNKMTGFIPVESNPNEIITRIWKLAK